MSADATDTVDAVAVIEVLVRSRMAAPRAAPLVLGLCGAQGSGKSTMAAALLTRLAAPDLRVALLSLDDLYLDLPAREHLARTIHPLFRTRGVPCTHDVALGRSVLSSLAEPGVTMMPRFDKARDRRQPFHLWEPVEGPVDLVLFEGWCVGARPQPRTLLETTINALERTEDVGGIWRRHANTALAGPYQVLFERVDALVLLAAPNFNVVATWRAEQERTLRDRLRAAAQPTDGLMDTAQIARFIQHYERLTRHILLEMPRRADLVLRLDDARRVIAVTSGLLNNA